MLLLSGCGVFGMDGVGLGDVGVGVGLGGGGRGGFSEIIRAGLLVIVLGVLELRCWKGPGVMFGFTL